MFGKEGAGGVVGADAVDPELVMICVVGELDVVETGEDVGLSLRERSCIGSSVGSCVGPMGDVGA
jgi:hypothetical protein